MSEQMLRDKFVSMISKIDECVEDTKRQIMEQLEIGYMTPSLLKSFIDLLQLTIYMLDDRRKLVMMAKTLNIDIDIQ